MNKQKKLLAIGIDVGGTKLEVDLIDQSGKLLYREQYPTRVKEGFEQVEKEIAEAIRQMQKKVDSPISAVGVGLAGQIDSERGIVKFAPNLKWNDVHLKEDLERLTNLPFMITNDVRAATWGEWLYGEGVGCKDLICMFVGTGIGAGIVSGGQMLTGSNNSAGEIGHMTIMMDGPICSCGNRGCFEAFAGGWAIAKRAKEEIAKNPEKGKKILNDGKVKLENITAKSVIQAALDNDILGKEIIEETTKALIAGSIGIINAFNPSRFILGGGIIKGYPDFVPLIEEGLKKYALKTSTESLIVRRAHFKEEAGAVGAAAWALGSLKKNLLNRV
jgi:glucokinase